MKFLGSEFDWIPSNFLRMDGMPHIFFWGDVQEAYSIQIGTLQIVLSLQELGPAAGSGQREKKTDAND